MLYCFDTEGWVEAYETSSEADAAIEWINIVVDLKYVVIDERGVLYEPSLSGPGIDCYTLRPTKTRLPRAAGVLKGYAHGDQLDAAGQFSRLKEKSPYECEQGDHSSHNQN